MEAISLRHSWGISGAPWEQWLEQDCGCHSSSAGTSRCDSWPSGTTILGSEGLVSWLAARLKTAEPPQYCPQCLKSRGWAIKGEYYRLTRMKIFLSLGVSVGIFCNQCPVSFTSLSCSIDKKYLGVRVRMEGSISGDFEGVIPKNTQQAILLRKRTSVLGASFLWPTSLHLERSWWRQMSVLAAGMKMGVWEHSCASDASQWGILHTICTVDGKTLSGSSAGFFSDVLNIRGIDACFLLAKLISWRPLFPKYNTGNYCLNFQTWCVIILFSEGVRNCYFTSARITILLLWKEFVTDNYKKRHLTRHLRQKGYCLDHLHLSQGSYMKHCDASSEKLYIL